MKSSQLSTRPLYLQLRDALAERIAKGEWKPGTALPNERDLARECGLSPGTMRKALDLMESEHLVTRRQGRGTYVNDQSSDELSVRFINIRGPDGERIIGDVTSAEITEGAVNEMECVRLRLETGDRVYRIRRVRLIDDQPFMLEETSVPVMLFPELVEMGSFTHRIVLLPVHRSPCWIVSCGLLTDDPSNGAWPGAISPKITTWLRWADADRGRSLILCV